LGGDSSTPDGSDPVDTGSDGDEAGSDGVEAGSDGDEAGSDGVEAGSDGDEAGSDGVEAGSDGVEAGSDGGVEGDFAFLITPYTRTPIMVTNTTTNITKDTTINFIILQSQKNFSCVDHL
jgi:hypothetical protein